MTPDAALHVLADAVGIVPDYLDQTGRERRTTRDETRVLLLAALGIDASTTERAANALRALREAEAAEIMPPVRVVEVTDETARCVRFRTPSPSSRGTWRVELLTEAGEHYERTGEWHDAGELHATFPLDVPLGYHRVRVTLSADGRQCDDDQTLIVVPPHAVLPDALLGDDATFGVIANLYTLRSARNWGVGDLGDLRQLILWTAETGGDFVGVNPLHALLNRGADISPYSPVSRLFRNPIYLDVCAVPELEQSPELRARIDAPEFQAELAALRESSAVRYEQVMAVKGLALDALYRVFAERVRGAGSDRAGAYDAYVAGNDPALTRFATWMTLAEHQSRTNGSDWRTWPEEIRHPDSPGIARFVAAHADRVDFHRWVQFELDRQLGAAAAAATSARMRIGLYQDLAIGSSPAGADAWAYPELFVAGVSVGAPPDSYAANGQNWGLPPIDPRALRRDRYRYFIQLVRTGFRHAGALRIDHVMGLFRLFWIPEGRSGRDGAYIRYPWRDLLGILALESVRHRALVVGEDLGTVPEDVPPALTKWGVLSSKVLYFERDAQGGFKPASEYPPLALATANTHDMAPISGFWNERDIDLRAEVGLLETADDVTRVREERDSERRALVERLVADGVLPPFEAPRSDTELRRAVHEFLCQSPARLVGLSLDDLAGEAEPVNVPGIGPEKHPSWTRKMRMTLEDIASDPNVAAALPSQAGGR